MFVSRQHPPNPMDSSQQGRESRQWYDYYASRVTSTPIMGLRVFLAGKVVKVRLREDGKGLPFSDMTKPMVTVFRYILTRNFLVYHSLVHLPSGKLLGWFWDDK
jgi:hypothetical protein